MNAAVLLRHSESSVSDTTRYHCSIFLTISLSALQTERQGTVAEEDHKEYGTHPEKQQHDTYVLLLLCCYCCLTPAKLLDTVFPCPLSLYNSVQTNMHQTGRAYIRGTQRIRSCPLLLLCPYACVHANVTRHHSAERGSMIYRQPY